MRKKKMAPKLSTMAAAIITVVALTLPASLLAQSNHCPFNPLCTCSSLMRNVSCIGIPFATMPHLLMDRAFQLNILRSGIEVLKDYAIQGIRISSLRMAENELSVIYPKAFYGSESTLTTIDLSFNKLRQLPMEALIQLQVLDWLSLQSNDIEELPRLVPKPSLKSLLLGNNQLFQLTDGCFSELENLITLNLDRNAIVGIGNRAFPSSLQRLSLSNNLLRQVPIRDLQHLQNLTWLHMGGNLFNELPNPLKLPVNYLDNLDLSHNLLVSVPSNFINNSGIKITNLSLEFNNIQTLDPASFQGMTLDRLSLANNHLTFIQDGAFKGLQNTLKALDISYNLLETFPKAIKDLVTLNYLSLRENYLEQINGPELYGCRDSLETLDLSGNKFNKVPGDALRFTKQISQLYLQDNIIFEIRAKEFEIWGRSLTALNLENNKLQKIPAEAFLGLNRLKELKLSYNSLLVIDPEILKPIRRTLEIFEIGYVNTPALDDLQGLETVKWLQMDHNNLKNISPTAFESMPSLIHCDLEGNNLQSVPFQLFQSKVHTSLKRVVLANNNIKIIDSNTFHELPLVTDIVLSGNNLNKLATQSFYDMKLLSTIVLSGNKIQTIENGAFTNLSSITDIFLHDNYMKEFSFEMFHNVGNIKASVSLNLSNNQITKLKPLPNYESGKPSIKVHSLDLSNNRIYSLTKGFLRPVGETLHYLFLSSNRISSINSFIFEEVPNLQVIHISNNTISALFTGVFQVSPMLQIIDISHNNLSFISKGAFNDLNSLRVLDLSYNGLKTLPEDMFAGSKVERLNLSNNSVVDLPFQSLSYVQSTLRYLDVSQNRINLIPVDGFNEFQNLLNLNLSYNQLTDLNETIFSLLAELLHLDLSHNELRKLDDELFKPLASLQTLILKNVSISNVPSFPLPSLRTLDLSFNLLYNVSESFVHLKDLRHLDLSHNDFSEVPQHVWPNVTKLTYLDMSYNPIQGLNMDSFGQLERLRELDVRGLNLKYLDFRTLHNLKFLNTFKTNTYTSLRSFRLSKLLSKSDCLQRIVVEVEEKNLTHQLQWTFGSKLQDLTITGQNLQYIRPDAFLGLQTHELTLRITGTSISRLPKGLLKYLAGIRYLTLDLRGNLLTSMDETVLCPSTTNSSTDFKTQRISGGIFLENNPWVCNCNLIWLGDWIRRWMRDTRKVQTLHSKDYWHSQNLPRKALCTLPSLNETIAIVDINGAVLSCATNDTEYVTQNNAENYTQNNAENYTQNNAENYTQNNTLDYTKNYTQDYTQYDILDYTEDYSQDSTQNDTEYDTEYDTGNNTTYQSPTKKGTSNSTTFQIQIWMMYAALVTPIFSYYNYIPT